MAWQDRGAIDMSQFRRTAPVDQRKKKSFWQDQISTGGGIGGALAGGAAGAAAGSVIPVVGTAAGGILGALLGGAAGGGAGQVAENAVVGDELGKDVGREALLNGVFGAGPIRAGSLIARTGSNLVRGAGKNALSQAGTKAITDTPIRNFLGKSAAESSKNLAIRPLGLTKGQKGSVRDLGRGTAADIAQKYDIKSFGGIEKAIADNNARFGQIVDGINTVPKSALKETLDSSIGKLSSGKSTGNLQAAKSLKAEADALLKRLPENLTGKQLNTIKREYDALVSEAGQLADPAVQGVNKRIADALRTTVQKSTGSSELKELGLDLRALNKLKDVAAKNLESGTGKSGLRATDIAFGVGGMINPAALGGIAAARALSSDTAARLASSTTGKASNALLSSATKNAANSSLPKDSVRNLSIVGALNGLGGQSLEKNIIPTNPTMNTTSPNATMPNTVSNMPQSYQNGQEMSIGDMGQAPLEQEPSIGGFSKSQLENAMAMAALDGNEDAFGQLKDLYDMLPAGGGEFGDLSQSSRNALASSDNAINTVNQLEQLYNNAGGARGRLGGMLGNLAADAGFDSNANSYNSLADASVTQIAKALAGSGAGTVSDMDAKVIIQALPRLNDTPEEAATKFAALRARLENARQNTLMYGGGASEAPADQMTQQPYGY